MANVNIANSVSNCEFDDLGSGDIFIVDDRAYIKLDVCESYVKAEDTRQDINAVDLETGEGVCFLYKERVIYPNNANINIDL